MEHIQRPTLLEKTKEILERDFYWDRVEYIVDDHVDFFKGTKCLTLHGDGTVDGLNPHPALKQTLIGLGWDL